MRDNLRPITKNRPTPWGFSLAGNAEMAAGMFEPAETALVRALLADVDILVNVGANIGYYCCHALSMGKSVIAFEPLQQNLRHLYHNINSNGWKCAEVFPVALSNRTGILQIFGGATGASLIRGWAGTPAGYATLVPSSTLDTVLGDRLQGRRVLVIVDVEGAEGPMLDGATKLLANVPKPTWLVEIVATMHQPAGMAMNPDFAATFERFARHGYQPRMANVAMRPLPADYVDLISRRIIQAESHNYLFRERAVRVSSPGRHRAVLEKR